ncbi:MAG: hypothetical protein COT15_03430 [Candidatus Diapherotrites archaeon CG08_land_8_20_14_0_20_34_12]|nr:MAG: hypothetical protein COT15_03430 [Candidatus Diapherotrites archaeon CG08_land_8_20_14_0_20_34_12]
MNITNLTKVNIFVFLTKLLFGSIIFFIPLYLTGIKLSGLEIGLLLGIFSISGLLLSLPIGISSDLLSSKKNAIFGFIAASIFLFGISFFNQFYLLVILFFIGGFGFNATWVSLQTIMLKSEHGKKGEGKKVGKYNLFFYFGSAASFFTAGLFLNFYDYQTFFRLLGFLFLIVAVMAFSLKDAKRTKVKIEEYTKGFFTKEVLLFLIPLVLFTFHWGAEVTSYTLFLKQAFALNTFETGLYLSIPVIFLGIVAYLGGKWIDKKGDYKKLFAFAILISGIGHITMIYPNLAISFTSRIVHEIGDGLAMTAIVYWTAKLFKKDKIGGHASAITTITLFSQFLGSVIFGPIGESFGYGIPLAISGALMLIAIPFVLHSKK